MKSALAVVVPANDPLELREIDPLSPRERDVLKEIASGATIAETAQRLGLKPNTAQTHLKHVYQKLGIKSRSEAALAAVRLGLITL